jgi:hypothetical protein
VPGSSAIPATGLPVPEGFKAKAGATEEPYTKTDWAKEIVHEATGLELAFIPAGEFDMGSPESEEGRDGRDEARYLGTGDVPMTVHCPFCYRVCPADEAAPGSSYCACPNCNRLFTIDQAHGRGLSTVLLVSQQPPRNLWREVLLGGAVGLSVLVILSAVMTLVLTAASDSGEDMDHSSSWYGGHAQNHMPAADDQDYTSALLDRLGAAFCCSSAIVIVLVVPLIIAYCRNRG